MLHKLGRFKQSSPATRQRPAELDGQGVDGPDHLLGDGRCGFALRQVLLVLEKCSW
jgi:hypothetical protein